ncbi:MAG: MBL fold metallo-hydrolase [Rhodobacteraceae bacterium]|nr:MAG: MBL fold metallo-hydrolase [Paracoccaceae bacterium]
MTFTGTASYVIADGRAAVIVDPGPDDPAHRDALLAALPPFAEAAAVLVTHSHRDHSPGAAPLAKTLSAPVLAFGPHGAGMTAAQRARAEAFPGIGGGEGADHGFAPDRALSDGATVAVGGRRLIALHTPGHLSNHLCFALDGEGVVFTGDHVMGWATTMVSPPDGDMGAFMASLALLQGRGDRLFLPGHGPPVANPDGMIAWQLAHRRAREAQILDALAGGPATPEALTRRLYAAVDPALWPAAKRNVLAHLLSLVDAGRVVATPAPAADAAFACAPSGGAG